LHAFSLPSLQDSVVGLCWRFGGVGLASALRAFSCLPLSPCESFSRKEGKSCSPLCLLRYASVACACVLGRPHCTRKPYILLSLSSRVTGVMNYMYGTNEVRLYKCWLLFLAVSVSLSWASWLRSDALGRAQSSCAVGYRGNAAVHPVRQYGVRLSAGLLLCGAILVCDSACHAQASDFA